MHLSILPEHYKGSVNSILKQYTKNVSVYCHQQDTRRLLRGVWFIGNAFWLWPVLLSVNVGNKLRIRVKCLVGRFLCLKSLHLLFRLETLLQRLEVRWSVFRELHGLCNLRAASLPEVLIVGGLIVTTKSRRADGDNYTTLLLKAKCHNS